GPDVNPYFYDPHDRSSFLLGNPERTDLPRMDDGIGTAVIGDPRNDSNVFVSQLHVAFLNFHNYVVAREKEKAHAGAFERAQRLVRWQYQWIVRHEYLPKIVEPSVIKNVEKEGRRFFHWNGPHPFLPVEFSVAAFRFGHSQIRESYQINP